MSAARAKTCDDYAAECKRDKNFTCANCGARWEQDFLRNACPDCLWSRHVMFGAEAGSPPCGSMMKPVEQDAAYVLWECTGCGFSIGGPSELAMTLGRAMGQLSNRWYIVPRAEEITEGNSESRM